LCFLFSIFFSDSITFAKSLLVVKCFNILTIKISSPPLSFNPPPSRFCFQHLRAEFSGSFGSSVFRRRRMLSFRGLGAFFDFLFPFFPKAFPFPVPPPKRSVYIAFSVLKERGCLLGLFFFSPFSLLLFGVVAEIHKNYLQKPWSPSSRSFSNLPAPCWPKAFLSLGVFLLFPLQTQVSRRCLEGLIFRPPDSLHTILLKVFSPLFFQEFLPFPQVLAFACSKLFHITNRK